MASHLPEDIVIIILSWLPPICLVRFRVVCKSWCTLLSDPKFMYKNILQSRDDEKSSTYLLVKSRNKITKRHAFSFISDDTLEISMVHGLPHSGGQTEAKTNIVGSCNGLVCLHTYFSNIVLWNPATKENKVLPQSHVPRSPDRHESLHQLGFGFDPKTKDYKVVRIVDLYRDGEEELIGPHIDKLVEVYSLRNDSWRKLEVVLPADFLQGPGWHTVSCDTYQWRGLHDQSEKESIVSFDMSSETFRMKLLPDFNEPGDLRWNTRKMYFKLNKLVAMVNTRHKHEGGADQCAEVWIQLEDGVEPSWTKLFTIEPLKAVGWAIGFKRTGEVFFRTYSGQVLLYEPITQEVSTLPITEELDTLQIVTYRESQVSLMDDNS